MSKPIFIGVYDENDEEVFINPNCIVSFKQDGRMIAIKMANGDTIHTIVLFAPGEFATVYDFYDLLTNAIERATHEKSDSKKT